MSKKKNENEVLLLLLLLLLFLLKNLPIIIPFIKPKKKNGEGTVPPEPEPIPYVPPSPDPIPKVHIAPRPIPLPAPILLPSPSPIPKVIIAPRHAPLPKNYFSEPIPYQVRRLIEDEERYERNIPSPVVKPLPKPIQVRPNIPTVKPITGTPGLLPGMKGIKVGPVTIPNPIEAILIGVPTIVGAASIPSLIPIIAATAAGSSIIPAIGAKPTVSVKPKVNVPAKPIVIVNKNIPSKVISLLKQGKL